MRLFDVTEIADVREEDFQEVILDRTKKLLQSAPENSRLKRELAACDRLFKIYNDDADIINNLRIAYLKSKPLMSLNQAVLRGKMQVLPLPLIKMLPSSAAVIPIIPPPKKLYLNCENLLVMKMILNL